jgi:tRNA (cmo5U34)-methyltransferase
LSQTYRWNVADHAAGYDEAAHRIHPYYLEIQEVILAQIARPADAEFLVVDLGGGSGRLAEKILTRFPRANVVVVDQSEPFLEIASARMARFDNRGSCVTARLQDDWTARLPSSPAAITSMSAIHHLDREEKQRLYRRCHDALEPLGILLNGDEIRAVDDREYLAALATWAAHMRHIVAAGLVNEAMRPMLEKWQDRNVAHFAKPRTSGDDCHETVEAQLGYFCECGFRSVGVPWQQQMWAVIQGIK